MSRKLVIALGGNALGDTPDRQLELVKTTASTIVDLVEEGYDVVVGHGNGPQVGMVNLAFEFSSNNGASVPDMPLPECGAMTQGYIGYHLQQAIQRELKNRSIERSCAAVVTQIEVDPSDPAFQNPTKPIGMYYPKEKADAMIEEYGFTFMQDPIKGFRRVVPSPLPVNIVEMPLIRQLVDSHNIVITVGGGGIPVIKDGNGYKGIAAVIDKDRACSSLALDLEADMLVILTNVEKVCINYRTPEEKQLDSLTIEQAQQYIENGQFGVGSMLPKVESCITYLQASPNGKALITSLEKARDALAGKTGTVITR